MELRSFSLFIEKEVVFRSLHKDDEFEIVR